jgi:hypothetical protein
MILFQGKIFPILAGLGKESKFADEIRERFLGA